jgi:hypothetical protein
MNILTDTLPTEIDISGEICQINADFRSCLRIILAFEDGELSNVEKQIIMLHNLFVTQPRDAKAAMERCGWFLNGGKVSDGDNYAPRLYSFSKDADMIFSAFRQTHNIDLTMADLHWWEFLALFMDLGADTTFCNLINLRRRVKTGKATKEEKQTARELGEMFEVPEVDDRTLEEREANAEFERLLQQAGR